MKNSSEKLHDRLINWANTKQGSFSLFIFAFADASFLPLPVTTLFIFLALFNTPKTFRYAFFTTIGTVAGAMTGYAIGYFSWIKPTGEFTSLAHFFMNNIPGFSTDFYTRVYLLFERWGGWIITLSAGTPLPFGLLSIASGVFKINFFVFIIFTMISQGLKFYFLSFLILKYGASVKKLFAWNWKPIAIVATAGIILAITIINSRG